MTVRDLAGTASLAVLGGAFGWPTGPVGIGILAGVGVVLGIVVTLAGVRWLVAVPVLAGTGIGALAGWNVIHAICQPAGCPGAEISTAVVTGVGSFVGVGLVVALAARSFDEYREATAMRRSPPDTGRDADEETGR